MVEQIDLILKIDRVDAEKTASFDIGTYDDLKEEFTVPANLSKNIGWRLVYKDKQILAMFEATEGQVTRTIHNIEEFATEDDCLKRVKELGLDLKTWLLSQEEK